MTDAVCSLRALLPTHSDVPIPSSKARAVEIEAGAAHPLRATLAYDGAA